VADWQDWAMLRVVSVVLDAIDVPMLARFWSEALAWEIGEIDGEVGLVPPGDTPFNIVFEPTSAPKVGKNRNHLDLTTTSLADQEDTVKRLLTVGGRPVDIGQRGDEGHIVLADPEGNELCILEPGNNFLAGAPRLGAVNCDGTRRVGQFWSEALGWPLVWDQDEETAVREPGLTGPLITWSGPPLLPKHGKNRLHLDVAPPADGDQQAEVERLVGLGARRIDVGQGEVSWVVMADPDDNELCVLTPR
jgi:hypothetical protein